MRNADIVDLSDETAPDWNFMHDKARGEGRLAFRLEGSFGMIEPVAVAVPVVVAWLVKHHEARSSALSSVFSS